MIRQDTNKNLSIRTSTYYKYLMRNQLITKVIANMYKVESMLLPNTFRHQRQLDIIILLEKQGLKKVLNDYGVIPFYTEFSIEGEDFWSQHQTNANREAYDLIRHYCRNIMEN